MCGLTHWNMLATVRVVPQDEYDAWMTEQAARPTPSSQAWLMSMFPTNSSRSRGLLSRPRVVIKRQMFEREGEISCR